MISLLIRSLLLSLLLTLAAELAAARLLGVRERQDLAVIALANIITNPLAVFIQTQVLIAAPRLFWLSLTVLELGAVAVEGAIYRRALRCQKIGPYALSLVLNLLSFSSGALINAIF